MHRRRLLAASAVGVASATAGCTGSLLGSGEADPGDALGAPPEDDPGNEIEVSADGDVEAEPDRASLSVGVEATGDSAEAVTEQLRADADDLRQVFDDLGIPDENVESGRFDVGQDRDGTRFEGSHSFQVVLDDPDRAGEVIDAVVAGGADDVGRVNFGLEDETRETLRQEALDEAFDEADAEAAQVAANREVTLTGTKAVSTSDVGVQPYSATVSYEMAEADDAGAPPTEIDAGPVSVSASVTVTYSFDDPDA